MSRAAYANIYGPTRGDLVRLADTSLLAEVERDFAHYGDELTTGAGKCMRDGEGFQPSGTYASGALVAAERNDFAVHIHTDTINEFGFCEDTLAMIGDRSVRMYHTEGSGGHAPDLIRVNGMPNVLPSSTNPTNPFTPAGLDEGVPMTMLAHFLNFRVPEDVAFAEIRG